jgi:S-layer homology domain
MASFLVRAANLPPSSTNHFTDDNASIHENDINALASAGVTGGCTASRYCPNSAVSRGQMASFLVRVLDLPATSQDYFTDDSASIHENDINALARAGVTGGCAAGRFCPTSAVSRGQMAAFLHRGFAP